MTKTSIDYLTHTWNPLAMRCTKVSPACDHCWHLAMANRLAANPTMSDRARAAYRGETGPMLIDSRLGDPLKHKKPAVIGVQFMGDLFHDDVPLGFLELIFDVIEKTPQHIYQILTKRTKNMHDHFADLAYHCGETCASAFPNVWLGVTVENQDTADGRRADLEATPAAVKFVSYEPALGLIDWTGWEFVDQIISGGETGPRARPSPRNAHRSTRDFCQANDIAYFFKQHGEWLHFERRAKSSGGYYHADNGKRLLVEKFIDKPHEVHGDFGIARVGNKAAGHLLDGREWREMPGGER